MNFQTFILYALMFNFFLGVTSSSIGTAISYSGGGTTNAGLFVTALGQSTNCKVASNNLGLDCNSLTTNAPIATNPNILTFGWWYYGFYTISMLISGLTISGSLMFILLPNPFAVAIFNSALFMLALWFYVMLSGRYPGDID